jgi:hypothetical protein
MERKQREADERARNRGPEASMFGEGSYRPPPFAPPPQPPPKRFNHLPEPAATWPPEEDGRRRRQQWPPPDMYTEKSRGYSDDGPFGADAAMLSGSDGDKRARGMSKVRSQPRPGVECGTQRQTLASMCLIIR